MSIWAFDSDAYPHNPMTWIESDDTEAGRHTTMISEMNAAGDLKTTTNSFSSGAGCNNKTGAIMVILQQPGAWIATTGI